METRLVDDVVAVLAIPSECINGVLWPWLLQDDPDGVSEPYRIVRRVGGQQEERVFVDGHVDGSMRIRRSVHCLE